MRWLTQTELREITGLSRTTLQKWARRPGCPKRVVDGRTLYAWPDWNEWRFEEGQRPAGRGPDQRGATWERF